ncbi:tRNA threonylcarbamoyladenosine dehydratase [Papillibacter cinnamivorans]|uniref:tRNA A37 threonylcarbamoyladenosine dehydratase n=1 Tax=Papillibacter cinnamivorans DSM 12816 TaxID=1122930 RepID=A0A1W2AV84_9FIRM|nr:tRNA threonylcarbamoyladenosine dehydratase [Papillibacter cinnamivorans]SMC64524.1 tRNA A37 threonylcarbamoyladenosine dehydratase [Papillibacter cinnamivorans DSM 12816]
MQSEFSRTERILGKEAVEKLKSSSVAVFGLGGVGSWTAEALARSGVGAIALFDDDSICPSNINRQLPATHSTVGRKKTEVMKDRILDINPLCAVTAWDCFYSAQNAGDYPLDKYDYIVDAVDTVSSKLLLVERAMAAGVPIISCMGTGNKLDPARLEVADIYETSVCPLAKVMRKELRARGVDALKVVYSREEPIKPLETGEEDGCPGPETAGNHSRRRQVPGSVSFVPPVAGFLLASRVVRDLISGLEPVEKAENVGEN